ncbi:uncharacterized protein B0H64DRAFT_71326 [Chaetomium fimeti]|uniref:Uncharacterized protein n=1 Tax=Chaetomium fimeti TaxID=1854472 RepID=A0AAE0HKM0_9PEZI|nr:hypothetical protein B0H64DRAFT_71326 [Chaetomium fimeti]
MGRARSSPLIASHSPVHHQPASSSPQRRNRGDRQPRRSLGVNLPVMMHFEARQTRESRGLGSLSQRLCFCCAVSNRPSAEIRILRIGSASARSRPPVLSFWRRVSRMGHIKAQRSKTAWETHVHPINTPSGSTPLSVRHQLHGLQTGLTSFMGSARHVGSVTPCANAEQPNIQNNKPWRRFCIHPARQTSSLRLIFCKALVLTF